MSEYSRFRFLDPFIWFIAVLFILLLAFAGVVCAQPNIPQATPVVGAEILQIETMALSGAETRIVVSTFSPNSLMYADMDHSVSPPTPTAWQAVPDMDMNAGYGYDVVGLACDGVSGFIYASHNDSGLVGLDCTPGSLFNIDPREALDVEVYDSHLYYVIADTATTSLYLYWRTINPSGTVNSPDSLLVSSSFVKDGMPPNIMVSPSTQQVYVFIQGTPPALYRTSDLYNSLSSASTTLTGLPLTDVAATGNIYAYSGIAPDGRIILAGYSFLANPPYAYVAYSDDEGDPWTTYDVPTQHSSFGNDIAFSGNSSAYHVYIGRMVSDAEGTSGSWSWMPTTTSGAAPRNSFVGVDPNDNNYIYIRTNWGMAYSDTRGNPLYDMNDDMYALQVNDFDQEYIKEDSWVATLSGIWYVEDYQTSPVWTAHPIWPGGDTRPYYSVATTVTADTVYAGNSGVIYRYDTSSGPVSDMAFTQLFDGHTYYDMYHGETCIAYDSTSSIGGIERIAVGFNDMSVLGDTLPRGGIIVGTNSGGWNWLEITGGAIPSDGADINDIVVVDESGVSVIYAATNYEMNAFGTTRSIYRVEELPGGGWDAPSQDMLNAYQNISASIFDLEVAHNGDLYACGTDAGGNHPVIYQKVAGGLQWNSLTLTLTGLPSDGIAHAVTYDNTLGDLYIAVNHEVYVLTSGASSWSLYSSYPVGTDIQFMYYDELMVGTGTGLYAHIPDTDAEERNTENLLPETFELGQPYPNPFNATMAVELTLPRATEVHAEVYNVNGRLVTTLVNQGLAAGNHRLVWHGNTDAGITASSGMYFLKVNVGDTVQMRRMTLIK